MTWLHLSAGSIRDANERRVRSLSATFRLDYDYDYAHEHEHDTRSGREHEFASFDTAWNLDAFALYTGGADNCPLSLSAPGTPHRAVGVAQGHRHSRILALLVW